MNNIEEIAGRMYSAYCAAVGGTAFNGDPLPDWPTFRADPEKRKQSDAWVAAAKAACTFEDDEGVEYNVPPADSVKESDYDAALAVFANEPPSRWFSAAGIILVKQQEDASHLDINVLGLVLRLYLKGRVVETPALD